MSGRRLARRHKSKQLVRKHRNRENRIHEKRDKKCECQKGWLCRATENWSDTGTSEDWHRVIMVQAKTDTQWQWYRRRLIRSDTGTGEDCTEWHWYRLRLQGVTMVQAKTARSDIGTYEDWYGATMVQAKTDTEWHWYRRRLIRSDTGTD